MLLLFHPNFSLTNRKFPVEPLEEIELRMRVKLREWFLRLELVVPSLGLNFRYNEVPK